MFTPSKYPKHEWEKHASKYFWTKQNLQSNQKNYK
jgi:hypothetical protein